ncbi:LysR substrate-binding domain-containing protein [uncultured Cohaesibacter sp.]|uniref:LysR substrate-binding domain-containing protein n=1 Tax=uncultured Cohaesibacter sp. TaxID=1002546 RepID=UPI0029C67092|nr:LysR substrate-binding domain-containing protein [uncultured Cohaesibacter sp.]
MTIRPTLRQLQYLCALAEKQSFRGAAEACLVSQSTLSAGIQQLEQILQVRLVDRESDHFRLTRIGSEILARAQVLLRDADDLVALAQQQQAPLSGELRLGVIPSIGPFLLPRALPELRSSHPNLRLFLRETLTRHLLDDVKAGRLDAAVIALPYHIEGFGVQSLGTDQFYAALPLNHPLADKDVISARDFRHEPLVLLEDGHCIRDHVLTSLKRTGPVAGG